MTNDEEKIPPFVQDYLNKMEYEGYGDFVALTRDYHKEREEYPGKYAAQSAHLNDFNRATGGNRQLNYEDGLKGIDTRYKQRAYAVAKQHGYNGPDPNQPSDKTFTKQGEKFQSMIDDTRQRQQEQATEQQQKRENELNHEKKNIKKLKEQQPYQQQQLKVKFEGTEPQQTPNINQQRAAFLSQIKKAQQQHDTQPEI